MNKEKVQKQFGEKNVLVWDFFQHKTRHVNDIFMSFL